MGLILIIGRREKWDAKLSSCNRNSARNWINPNDQEGTTDK